MQHQHFGNAAQWWGQIHSEDSMALSELCKSGKSSQKLLGWESSPTGAPSAGNQISDLLNSFLDLETTFGVFPDVVAGSAQGAVATSCKRPLLYGQYESSRGQCKKADSCRAWTPRNSEHQPIDQLAWSQMPGLRRLTWTEMSPPRTLVG
jgi:hypothetical protein